MGCKVIELVGWRRNPPAQTSDALLKYSASESLKSHFDNLKEEF